MRQRAASQLSYELLVIAYDNQGPDNYVVQNASFCLSKMQFFFHVCPGLWLYFKTEILLLFQYILMLC